MGPLEGDTGLAPMLPEDAPWENEVGGGELPTESGGKSTDTTEEPVMSSPRLIPIPGPPANSGELACPPIMGDSGKTSVFFQQCAPSQDPGRVGGNYDHLSRGQIHDLCKSRGHFAKDAKAVLKTRLEAMVAVARQSLKLDENAMDTSPAVLGKRDLSLAEPMSVETSTEVVEGKRSRGATLATTMAVDLAVIHARAQWWSPDLKPKMRASPSATAEGAGCAISAWVADGRNRISGRELTSKEEGMHRDSVKAGKSQ